MDQDLRRVRDEVENYQRDEKDRLEEEKKAAIERIKNEVKEKPP